MRVVAWGTYDTGKPRVRILLRGLRENGIEVLECHAHVWDGVEDKSQLRTIHTRARFALKWLMAYPRLVWRYIRLPQHDVVLVGYLGQLDVLVLWPFAKLRNATVVWDAFLSLYDTLVNDRKTLRPYSPLARMLFAWEWLACRAADCILLDTEAHADYFAGKFDLPSNRVTALFVGVEPERFHVDACSNALPDAAITVLFYGQFSPLHGVHTIIAAAQAARNEAIQWVLIGQGQEQEAIGRMLAESHTSRIQWIPWVPYERLVEWIQRADVCLGIFGSSGKAARVIPNKVFQCIACQKPIITRDSPAIRELLDPEMAGVYLIKPENSAELLAALHLYQRERSLLLSLSLHETLLPTLQPAALGAKLLARLRQLTPSHHSHR